MGTTFEEFSLGQLFQSFFDFIDTFFNDVLNNEMTGLIKYLFNCFPAFLRSFMFVSVIIAVLIAIYEIIKK